MTAVTANVIEAQLAAVCALFPGTETVHRPDGTDLIMVPRMPLPTGWNQRETVTRFLAPVGFPMARPDCFWADATLRLANGSMPNASGVQQLPGETESWLWFSWHLGSWNPLTDTLLTYVRVIQNRFAQTL